MNLFQAGDPVNWVVDGKTVYGFVAVSCPSYTPHAFRVRVIGLDNAVWLVDIEKLHRTQ